MRSPQTVLLVLVALRIHAVAPEQQSTVTQTVASRKHMQTLHKGSGHLMHVTCSSHGISTTRNHHAIISMTGGTCQQEHTGTHPHTHNLNCFPSNVRSASVGAARICCCTLSICTEQQLITSLTLITTVCARTECNALNMRPCHRRTAPHDRDKHAYITYTPDTQYIHCKHYIHNAVNEITHS